MICGVEVGTGILRARLFCAVLGGLRVGMACAGRRFVIGDMADGHAGGIAVRGMLFGLEGSVESCRQVILRSEQFCGVSSG